MFRGTDLGEPRCVLLGMYQENLKITTLDLILSITDTKDYLASADNYFHSRYHILRLIGRTGL